MQKLVSGTKMVGEQLKNAKRTDGFIGKVAREKGKNDVIGYIYGCKINPFFAGEEKNSFTIEFFEFEKERCGKGDGKGLLHEMIKSIIEKKYAQIEISVLKKGGSPNLVEYYKKEGFEIAKKANGEPADYPTHTEMIRK